MANHKGHRQHSARIKIRSLKTSRHFFIQSAVKQYATMNITYLTTSFRKIVTRDLTDSDFSVILFSVPDVDELCLLCICFLHGRSPTEE